MIRKITITALAAICVSISPVFASESTKQDAQAAAQQTTTFTAESAVNVAVCAVPVEAGVVTSAANAEQFNAQIAASTAVVILLIIFYHPFL